MNTESDSTIRTYAETILEESGWQVDRAKDFLVARSISTVAAGDPIKVVWRRSLDVAGAIERLAAEHEIQLRKLDWEADLAARQAEGIEKIRLDCPELFAR